MANDIIKSIVGKRFGLGPLGEPLVDPVGAGTRIIPRLAGNLSAAGTALTNSITETALASVTIKANTLQPGSLIQIRYQGIATNTNATDTLLHKLYIGGLSGTALLTGTATDVADNNVFWGEYELAIRTVGSSGTMVGVGLVKKAPAAEGTVTISDDILASTTIDTTADQDITVSGTWSVASASNSCRVDFLRVVVF